MHEATDISIRMLDYYAAGTCPIPKHRALGIRSLMTSAPTATTRSLPCPRRGDSGFNRR